MKIYITGAPKSGTTLLARMFNYFDCQVISEEVSPYDFFKLPDHTLYVGKRSENSLFSGIIHDSVLKDQLNMATDFMIINVVRDGRDTIHSIYKEWGVINPYIWINSIESALKYKGIIDLQVKYEDIVNRPDAVQRQIRIKFGLKQLKEFSIYPKGIPPYCFVTDKEHYKPRPLIERPANRKFFIGIGLDEKYIMYLNEKIGY